RAAAAELAARHPTRPEGLAARDGRADAVAAALDAWQGRPEPVALQGPTADELERELAGLPLAPEGDAEPHQRVRDAVRALDLARNAVAVMRETPTPDEASLPRIDEHRVRDLARRLRATQLPGAARLEEELADARVAAEGQRRPSPMPLLAGAGAALVLGLVLVALGLALPGVAAVAVAAGLGAWGWISGAASRTAADRLARAEAAVQPYREARAAEEADRLAAAEEARAAGLEPDPAELDRLADRLAAAAGARVAAEERRRRLEELEERVRAAERALLDAIVDRGGAAETDAATAWHAYQLACRRRADLAAAAAARPGLERQIEARRAAELTAAAAETAAAGAERRLREAAAAAGLDSGSGTDELVAGLRAWQRDRSERLRRNETAIAEWQRLQSLLDGSTLDELAERATADARRARELATQVGEPVATPAEPPAVLEARVARLNEVLVTETSRHDALRGSLQARREAVPDVAAAEESVLAAREELHRVEALAATLDRTLVLLRAAEERVHRSLSPVLAASVGRWLPLVCRGAYVDVSVDPADLSIRVKEAATGKWREARLLSEGTREQIYLLLRVAMAEHLVVNGETAPLLLDEVTVQSDPERKAQLLDVLHRLSAERQVVLFTHDDDVLVWADRRLDTERDATVLLPVRAGAAPTAAETPAGLAAVPIGD
ncbi:MAG TPA: hypothetical protein VF136_07405, partial [Methylomirabilota bacterium]